jgi:hypothetical protein
MKLSPSAIALIAIASIFSSCNYNPDQLYGELRSDGYIRYTVNGKKIFIPDSLKPGDPSIPLIEGEYDKRNSSLILRGSHFPSYGGIMIQILHCLDTGSFGLTSMNNSYASVYDSLALTTDSLHQGQFHLIRLDTINHKIAGTFGFVATTKNNPDTNTVIIDSGKFFNFPINISQ